MAEVRSELRAVRVSDRADISSDESLTIEHAESLPRADRVIVGTPSRADDAGRRQVEVVVDGWRFDLVIEDAWRAELRERASRDRARRVGAGERLEIRAIIPGRIASVAVTPGDTVELGQALLAVEAMKMQNELRAPRGGRVERVAASEGSTVEVGDLLIVLE